MANQKAPNFFLLGAPKCGTSAMRNYLASHPEVFFADPDEPGYFDRRFRYSDLKDCAYHSLEDYLSLYRGADPEKHKVIGEGSVYMLYSRAIISEILDLTPEARFAIMVRNPYEAAISMHGENLKSASFGREPLELFEDAWNDLANRNVDEISGVHPMRFRYDLLFAYNNHIVAVRDMVGADRVKIILYDDFRADNRAVAGDLYQFLGIDDGFEPRIAIHNERSQARDTAVARAVFWAARRARKSRILRPLRGKGLTLNRFTQKALPMACVSRELMSDMRRVFEGDIEALQLSLGRDLSTWLESDLCDRGS